MKILHRPHVFTIAVVTFTVFTMSPSQSRSLSPIGYLVNAIHITFGQGCLYFQCFPACLTVGAYTKWIGGAPSGFSFLPSVIGILVSGISMSEDSVVAAALAFRTFVMIRWVEERIVEGSIEGSCCYSKGVIICLLVAISSCGLGRRTFLFHSRDNFCGSSLSSCLLEPFMPLFSIEVLKLQAAPFTLRLSHRPLNTQGSDDYDQTKEPEDYVEAQDDPFFLVVVPSIWSNPISDNHHGCIARLPDETRNRSAPTNGYILVQANGGLNQMKMGISDMVAIAKLMDALLRHIGFILAQETSDKAILHGVAFSRVLWLGGFYSEAASSSSKRPTHGRDYE
ncbi:hypothetical protein Tco_0834550 [Tanacetum coccineum]